MYMSGDQHKSEIQSCLDLDLSVIHISCIIPYKFFWFLACWGTIRTDIVFKTLNLLWKNVFVDWNIEIVYKNTYHEVTLFMTQGSR